MGLRSAEEVETMKGFCEKIEILELSQTVSFTTRSGAGSELICCDEKDISNRVEALPSPKCRHFLDHRYYQGTKKKYLHYCFSLKND